MCEAIPVSQMTMRAPNAVKTVARCDNFPPLRKADREAQRSRRKKSRAAMRKDGIAPRNEVASQKAAKTW